MRICQDHWTKLRAALNDRGIAHLGAKDAQQAFEGLQAELADEPRDYDPLMDCHWMITSQALRRGGLYLLSQDDNGEEYCPVCEATGNGEDEEEWINGPADAALSMARQKGLAPLLS